MFCLLECFDKEVREAECGEEEMHCRQRIYIKNETGLGLMP